MHLSDFNEIVSCSSSLKRNRFLWVMQRVPASFRELQRTFEGFRAPNSISEIHAVKWIHQPLQVGSSFKDGQSSSDCVHVACKLARTRPPDTPLVYRRWPGFLESFYTRTSGQIQAIQGNSRASFSLCRLLEWSKFRLQTTFKVLH